MNFMKKLISLILFLCVVAMANAQERRNVYVNPLENNTSLKATTAGRLYKKGILGLTKANTIAVTQGDHVMTPGSDEAKEYDYILTISVDKIDAVDLKKELKDAVGEIGKLLGGKSSSSSSNSKPNYQATISSSVKIYDAATGQKVYEVDLENTSSNEDINLGYFQATNDYDLTMLDMTDEAFRISGEIVEATDVDKKGKVKKVRAQIGSKNGARKNMWFDIYRVSGGDQELMGTAKCEQVLNADESMLSVTGKKDGDKALNEAISNLDGSYQIVVMSRAKGGFMRKNLKTFDRVKFKSDRPAYLDPDVHGYNSKIAFINLGTADNSLDALLPTFCDVVLTAANKAATVEVVPTVYKSVESAREAGIDGLVEVSLDVVLREAEQKKNSKGESYTDYKSKLYFTITGIDVATGKYIDMLSKYQLGTSNESREKADISAIKDINDDLKNFCEDVFPITCTVMEAKKVNDKKQEVKEASIDIGTYAGVKKGMLFDIYEQRKEGDDDSRFLIGEGKVKGDGLDTKEAVISIKGKNDGDKRLFDLIKNMDEGTEIILVSKANHGVGGFLDNIIGNN